MLSEPQQHGTIMRDILRREDDLETPAPAQPQGAELRRAERYTLLIRTAKLIAPEGEFLCVIRDASETGVNVRIFHELPEEHAMMLELQNGDRHELEVVWQNEDRAGLKFRNKADIGRIVECPSQFAKRPIRINLESPAILLSGLQQFPATVLDISQQGAKLSCDHRFAIDQRVKLRAGPLPEVNAKIRWRRDDAYGLVFEDTFQFGDMARLVARLQNGVAEGSRTALRVTC